MELCVVRHAIAVPRSDELRDEERPLTSRGRDRFRRCVRGLATLEIGFDRVLHSPWLRAVQTAAELAPVLKGNSAVTDLLAAPPDDALLAEIGAAGARVAVVGHEPWTAELVALLIGDGFARVELKKGAVAHLQGEAERGGMVLRALLPPRVLVRLSARRRA